MQKPAHVYGMTKVEFARRMAAFEAAQAYRANGDQPREGLFTRLFRKN